MKYYWLSGAALAFACGITGGTAAWAQAEGPAGDTEQVDDEARLDTVTVSARKIEETAEDAPVAVSTLDEEALERLTIQSGIDIVRQIPSASFITAGPEYLSDISIRGQGAGRDGFSESATGIYRNGIYVAGGGFGGRSFNRIDFFDVANIETYLGPQSGLYGRNAVGGAVNVISNKPEFEPGGRVKVGYEDIDRIDVEAVGNLPLNDVFAVRVGGYYTDQDDGFYTDVATGQTIDFQENYGVRGSIRGQFSETTETNLSVEYYSSDAPSFAGLGERIPSANGGDFDPSEFERNASEPFGRAQIEEVSVLGDFTTDIGGAAFDLLFNYKDRQGERFDDDLDHFLGFQGVGGTELLVEQAEDFNRYTVEARLSGTQGNLNWLVGVDTQGFESVIDQSNSGSSFIPGLNALSTNIQDAEEELTSYSVFGNLDYQVNDIVSFSLEGRLFTDEKTFNFVENQLGVDVIDTGNIEKEVTKFLPGATLGFDFAEHGNVYLRFATGYRPFGFNTGVPGEDESFIPYDEEVVRSYEMGWKNSLANDRINYSVAAFFMDTDDPQLVTAISEEDTTTALQNVAGSEIYGLEAEINWRMPLGPGFLSGGLNASTIDGEFDDGTSLLVSVPGSGIVEFDMSGARVPRTRDYIVAFNSFYGWPVTSNVNAYIGGSIQAENGGYENAVGDSVTRSDPTIPNSGDVGRSLEGYIRGDLRAGLNWDGWSAAVYVRNVSDETYRLQQVIGNNYYNQPRKYGAELTFRF